ncbi:hypothetical protein QOU54_29205, partial [Pseudomonas aeruginosa]
PSGPGLECHSRPDRIGCSGLCGEGQALLGGAGGGEAGLKAKSPHKAGFWKMAHPAGFEPTTPAFGVLKVTLYDQDVSAE